jgi:uncharacterized protein (TIGR02996 family)
MSVSISDIVDRSNVEFARWAVERLGIDLAAEWPGLTDDQRDWLVAAGVVAEVEASVECTDAESWQSDWRTESGAAWPEYTLEVTAPGMEPLEVTGWHLVGYMGPDGNRQHREWDSEDGDGASNGLPEVDGWVLESGDNVGTDHPIPCWRHPETGRWVTLDRYGLGADRGCRRGSLYEAASTADHGSEPTWEDVGYGDCGDVDATVYILRDGEIREVTIYTGSIAGQEGRRDRDPIKYGAQAWCHDGDDDKEVYQSKRDCCDAIGALSDNEILYDRDTQALVALAGLVYDRSHELPDGVICRLEAGAVVLEWTRVETPGVSSSEETILDAADLSCVYRHGWAGVLDSVGVAAPEGVLVRPSGQTVFRAGDRTAVVGKYSWQRLVYFAGPDYHGDAKGQVVALASDAVAMYRAVVDSGGDRTAALVFADALDEAGGEDAAEVARVIREAVAVAAGKEVTP